MPRKSSIINFTLSFAAALFLIICAGQQLFAQNTAAKQYFDQGRTLLEAGNYNQAINSFRNAILNEREYADAYAELGIAYKEKGDLDQAVSNLEKSISISGNFFEPVYLSDAFATLGLIYLERSNLNLAYRYLDKARLVNPNSGLVYNYLGLFYLAKGSFDEAISNFRKAASLNPHIADDAYFNLALAYQRKGQADLAKHSLEEALRFTRKESKRAKILQKLKEIK